MGILDLFKGRPKEETVQPVPEPQPSIDLSDYAHLRVEVTSPSGQLIFVGKMVYAQGNTAELHQYSECSLPEDTEPVHVRIRGYHEKEKKAVYLEGDISPLPKHVWKAENLTVEKVGNERAFFRLETDIPAHVTKFSGIGAEKKPCRLLNISIGGARIAAEQRYWEGDKLMLNVRLFEDRDTSIIFCQVLRVIEKEDDTFEYGCQFLELTDADEERITQNIFSLQRKKRSGGR